MDNTETQEMLDIFDVTGTPLGVASRNEVHAKGLWHQVFHCLIVRSDGPARVVLQQRSANKKAFPNKLDFSGSGHLVAGESPAEGVRELNEELGLDVAGDQLIPAGIRLLADDQGEGKNRERIHAFFLIDDRPLDEYRPAAEEVDAVVEAKVADLLSLLARESTTIEATKSRSGGRPETTSLTIEDLVNPTDGYWVVALIMAERVQAGKAPISV